MVSAAIALTPGTAPSPAGGVEPVAVVAPVCVNLDPWSVETMNATNYFTDTGSGLRPATPARIVCYPEGGGEWTIEVQDADGAAIRDERGNYWSVWRDGEALDGFLPWTRDEAVAAAAGLAGEIGLPTLPVYEVAEDDTLTLVQGGAA